MAKLLLQRIPLILIVVLLVSTCFGMPKKPWEDGYGHGGKKEEKKAKKEEKKGDKWSVCKKWLGWDVDCTEFCLHNSIPTLQPYCGGVCQGFWVEECTCVYCPLYLPQEVIDLRFVKK